MRFALFFALVMSMIAGPLFAQDTGSISGRTFDTSGAAIPGVDITLTSDKLMGARTTVSDETGLYRFNLLPPGNYTVRFELPGFNTLVREGIVVEVLKTTNLNATLQISSVAETITVTGESPMVDVTAATVGVNFNQELLANLPNARDIWVVLAQTPGIQMTAHDVGGSRAMTQTGYRAHGATSMNWVNLDGVVINSSTSGLAAYTDYGAYQEIQISAAANSAEVPTPGVYMNSVVKQGSNDFHGEAYLDWEDDSFQSDNLTDELRNRGVSAGDAFIRYNDFNANIGGPVKRDKFWFFASWRDQYSSIRTQLKKRDGTQGAIFPTRIQDPTLKVNYQLTPNNQLIFMGQAGRKWQPFRGGSGGTAAFFTEDSTGTQDGWSWLSKVQWTSVISPKVTLDVSMNHMGLKYSIIRRVQERSFRDTVTREVRGGYSGASTGFSTSPPSRINRFRWNPKLYVSQFAQLEGSHSLKYGYEYDIYWDVVNEKGTIGDAIYYTSNGVPSFIETLNTPFNAHDGFRHHVFFAQDKWTIGRHLTLNIGVRFDRYLNYYRNYKLPERRFAPAQDVPGRKIYPAFNNWVPRLAMAYDVFGNGKTALKLSYGRYAWYAHNNISTAVNPVSLIKERFSWRDLNSDREFQPNELTFVQRISSPSRRVDPNLKNAYTDEYTASVDQEVMGGLQARFSAVRLFEKNLYSIVNAAIPLSAYNLPVNFTDRGRDGIASSDDRQLTFYGVDARYRNLQDLVLMNDGASNHFTSFDFTLTKRMANKWQLLGGWTAFRRNRSTSSHELNLRLFPSGDLHHWEWAFKMSGSYELPHGFSVSSVLKSQKGDAHGRNLPVSSVLSVSPAVISAASSFTVEPIGTFFLPAVTIWDVRLAKKFSVSENHKIDALFDLFNVPNANTILAVDTNTGPNFNKRVTQILNPRIFRLGVRYVF